MSDGNWDTVNGIVYLLGIVCFLIMVMRMARRHQIRKKRIERKVRLANPDPRFALAAKTAVVVHERRTTSDFGNRGHYTFHRILRNANGQYFLHIYSPAVNSSHVEYLPRERAMNALRDDPEAFRREFGEQGAPPAGGTGIA